MKKIFHFYRTVRLANDIKTTTFSYVPQRGIRYNESLKWVRPEKKTFFDPACTGDLEPMPKIDPSTISLSFQKSKELETADDKVKKVFSLNYQLPNFSYEIYKEELIKKVRNHPYDKNSMEVKIAMFTARIRHLREIVKVNPPRFPSERTALFEAITERNKQLRLLRQRDYKKFEWILETLNIEYKPRPVPDTSITRKKSLTLLAKLKVEKLKEEKLAALKKSYDEKKVPFLEDKLVKLRKIKAMEEKYELPQTVTNADIEECMERLEKTKIEVAERSKRNYCRKVHPYFLEPYDKVLLSEKEKLGGKIREEKFCKPKAASEVTS